MKPIKGNISTKFELKLSYLEKNLIKKLEQDQPLLNSILKLKLLKIYKDIFQKRCRCIFNDGVMTNIEYIDDGIKSLVTLATLTDNIMQNIHQLQ